MERILVLKDRVEIEAQEHFSYAKVYLERGEHERALGEFEVSLELDPSNTSIMIGIGQCHMALNNPEEAAKVLERVVSLAPQFADSHYQLGRAYNELGMKDRALNEFKEALNINPRYVAARRHMNRLMQSMDMKPGWRDDELEKEDKNELQISRQANIHFHLGNAFFQKNLLQEALVEYKEAIRLRPNFPDIRNRLGELYMKRLQYNLSEEEFKMALKINPKYIKAMLNLSEAYRLHSDQLMDKAEEGYQRVLEMDPENSKAFRGLEIIRSIKNIDFV
ncbi:MAG TPA: tetratricopeptide repeat protein [bacterium]|nr:tetratricopeptide repeat protein [bacterium]